jgi:hypothetical protein
MLAKATNYFRMTAYVNNRPPLYGEVFCFLGLGLISLPDLPCVALMYVLFINEQRKTVKLNRMV